MLPGNSVLKLTSWKHKHIFAEKLSLYEQTEFLMIKGIISAFDYRIYSAIRQGFPL